MDTLKLSTMDNPCIECGRERIGRSRKGLCYECRKKKRNAANKIWQKENSVKVNRIQKTWRINNPEKAKAIADKYRRTHKDVCNKRVTDWRIENRDYVLLNNRMRIREKYLFLLDNGFDDEKENVREIILDRRIMEISTYRIQDLIIAALIYLYPNKRLMIAKHFFPDKEKRKRRPLRSGMKLYRKFKKILN